jgi:catechol 2,3-dioxygenase-like lactoylglutathione lyase family enzyme
MRHAGQHLAGRRPTRCSELGLGHDAVRGLSGAERAYVGEEKQAARASLGPGVPAQEPVPAGGAEQGADDDTGEPDERFLHGATLPGRGNIPPMTTIVTGVDFVSIPTQDLERSNAFYSDTLGLRRTVYRPERNFAEFDTGTVTLSVVNPDRMGIGEFKANANHLALQVDNVAASRATLEERGVEFMGDIFDTGVCHMAFFHDPDGNALMLHHRYAPRTEGAV